MLKNDWAQVPSACEGEFNWTTHHKSTPPLPHRQDARKVQRSAAARKASAFFWKWMDRRVSPSCRNPNPQGPKGPKPTKPLQHHQGECGKCHVLCATNWHEAFKFPAWQHVIYISISYTMTLYIYMHTWVCISIGRHQWCLGCLPFSIFGPYRLKTYIHIYTLYNIIQ